MTVQASDTNTGSVFSKGFAGISWNGTSRTSVFAHRQLPPTLRSRAVPGIRSFCIRISRGVPLHGLHGFFELLGNCARVWCGWISVLAFQRCPGVPASTQAWHATKRKDARSHAAPSWEACASPPCSFFRRLCIRRHSPPGLHGCPENKGLLFPLRIRV